MRLLLYFCVTSSSWPWYKSYSSVYSLCSFVLRWIALWENSRVSYRKFCLFYGVSISQPPMIKQRDVCQLPPQHCIYCFWREGDDSIQWEVYFTLWECVDADDWEKRWLQRALLSQHFFAFQEKSLYNGTSISLPIFPFLTISLLSSIILLNTLRKKSCFTSKSFCFSAPYRICLLYKVSVVPRERRET